MTTLNQYQGVDRILQQLDLVRSRRWMLQLLAGAAATMAVALTALLAVTAVAGYWGEQPPRALRWGLLIALGLALAVSLGFFLIRAWFWRQNAAQTARFVEQAFPQLKNGLINSVLLASDRDQTSPELVQLAIAETAHAAGRHDLGRSVSMRRLHRWAIAAGVAALLLGGFGLLQPGPFHRGLMAVLAPNAYVSHRNAIREATITPGDATCFAGESLTIAARIRNDAGSPQEAQVLLAGSDNPRAMLPDDGNASFTCPLGPVEQTFQYCVRIGSSRWPTDKPYYTVTVLKRVPVEGLDVQYDFPPYTRLAARTVSNADGMIEAPIGSRATVTLRLGASVPAVLLEMQGGAAQPMMAAPSGKSFSAAFPIDKDGAYRLIVKDADGRTLQQLPDPGENSARDTFSAAGRAMMSGYYRVHAVPDKPPAIDFISPNRDMTVAPGGKLELRIKATDDYGLSGLSFLSGPEGQPPQPVSGFPAFNAKDKTEAVVHFTYDLAGQRENTVLVYYATATDNRNLPNIGGPQTKETGRFKITIQDTAKVEAERTKRAEELRNRLMALLAMQESQRVNTEICWKKHTAVAQIAAGGTEIQAGQQKIRAGMTDLVEHFTFDQELVSIQQALALLANNEARMAVDQAAVLGGVKELKDRGSACAPLAGTQDKIIEELQMLLAYAGGPASKIATTRPTSQPSELSAESKQRRMELKNELDKFIEEQKKIIQASERLAKKPVDQFTPEDEKLLRDLQTAQDKWEKFINEAFSEFSKLGQQDFSNPALLKELLEIKSDITMAKDALAKKAAEIATALEDNGIENAKTLTANIEKWLMDVPDREKWTMEDPGSQTNIEMPELPKELEDLIGDLLEEEEDIFDEMQDQTGKYLGSLDKGAGWGAADGPMANMNAQGVTGNQLPNNNEMDGRSGEGRQGKSSGEYVEDKAEGKGGRRTPTRLTPEPFQKGQVDDQSTDPAGGSTGGGKTSGAGGEGLEGPLPPPVQKEMDRLAGKQAALVNKAERLQGAFQQKDYANYKFLHAITLMNRVQSDLQQRHYTNALRSKDSTVAAIQQTKLLLSGNINVQADSSSAMPKYIRDDISDAMKGNLPAEYRDVLEQYYRRLSEQAK